MNSIKQYEISYQSLFQFIPKNAKLEKKISIIGENVEKLVELLKSIQTADFDNPIFDDPDCELYLLRLFKDDKITVPTFLCVYTYLLVLMEYGSQPIKEQDTEHCKFPLNTKPRMVPFLIDDEINPIFSYILDEIIEYNNGFESVYRPIEVEEVHTYFKSLSPAESAIISLNIENCSFNIGDKLGSVMVYATFLDEVFYQFNFSMTEYLNRVTYANPMRLFPGFGRIGNETLRNLHLNNLHFYPLYNKYVKNQTLTAHLGAVQGPFSIAQHDNFHCYLASMLSESEKEYVCGYLIDVFSNQSKLPEKVINALCYGDNSLNDLVTLTFFEPDSGAELDLHGDHNLAYFVANIIKQVFIEQVIEAREGSRDYEITKNFLNFVIDKSLSYDCEKRYVFKYALILLKQYIDNTQSISAEEKTAILKYYTSKKESIDCASTFFSSASSSQFLSDSTPVTTYPL